MASKYTPFLQNEYDNDGITLKAVCKIIDLWMLFA